ncbi:MAG: aminotransferase class IV [Kofleriaceae bacterium]
MVVPPERATISIFDRGFLFGDGLFETLRTWNTFPVDLDAHLERMQQAASALQMPIDLAKLRTAVRTILAAAGDNQDWRLKLIVTRGQGGFAMRFAEVKAGHTIVIAEPLPAPVTEISAAIIAWEVPQREAAYKSLSYLDSLIAKELAAQRGADEALRLGDDGGVVEGATSNLFIVKSGTVQTPPVNTGVLSGVTRAHVIECCNELRIPVLERWLTISEVRDADEIFVTSAVRGIASVTRLDGEVLDSTPVITQKLRSAYVARMSRATIAV